MSKVVPIRAGVGHCYLIIHQKGFFLVDTGSPGYANKITKVIRSRGLPIDDLQFIFLTHTHYDHAGNAAALKKVSGAPIIVHESEASMLRAGWHKIPEGTNPLFRIISTLGRKFSPSHTHFDGVEPDIVFSASLSTYEFGVEATLLHTPGHTHGSASLLFDCCLFGGDCIFNLAGKIWPPFANDEKILLSSWQVIDELEITWLYPAHGKRFRKSVLTEVLRRKRDRWVIGG